MRFKEIYFLLLCFVFTGIFATEDETECNKLCGNKFVGTDNEKDACVFGCGGRKSLSRGFFGYRICMNGCDEKYANSTEEDELKACKFACSLPFEQSFSMTLDLSGEKPKWNVVKQSGGGISRMLGEDSNDSGMSLSDILLKPMILSVDPPKPRIKEDDGDESVENEFRNVFNNQFVNVRTPDQMESAVRNIINSMLNQGQLFFEKTRPISYFEERPSGHELLALSGPEVGNQGKDGNEIITVVGNSEETQMRHRSYPIRWMVIIFALIFLTISMLCFTIFFRRSAIDEYARMRNNYFQQSETVGAGPIPVKKSMVADDAISTSSWQQKEPEGCAPPPYDQVSIHSKPEAKQ